MKNETAGFSRACIACIEAQESKPITKTEADAVAQLFFIFRTKLNVERNVKPTSAERLMKLISTIYQTVRNEKNRQEKRRAKR